MKKNLLNYPTFLGKGSRHTEGTDSKDFFLRIMRITAGQILLIALTMSVSIAREGFSQEILDRKVTLDLASSTLRDALMALEDQAEVKFVYSASALELQKQVTLKVSDQKLSDVLDRLLEPLSIVYVVKSKTHIVLKPAKQKAAIPGSEKSVFGMDLIEVRGNITDASSGGPLPGVNVILKGTTLGTVTDVDGNYSLNVTDLSGTLIFSYIGYVTMEVPINGRTTIDVVLGPDMQKLDEVVVIGYGEQSRELLTTSISKLDNKVLENTMLSNVGSALQGTIPGLRVINTSGHPGSSPEILLRGGASINNPGSPIVLVDGVVRTMSDINPSDIESIEVLKDAASTAIYGARANNGVILITTKRAKEGVSEISYNVKAGFNRPRDDYGYLNARDYVYYNRLGVRATNEARALGGITGVSPDVQLGYGTQNPDMFDIDKIDQTNRSSFNSFLDDGWQWMIDPYNDTDTLVFKDHSGEVAEDAFRETTFSQDHHISFTGSNEKGKFYSSLGYYNEQGILFGTEYQRFTGSLNGSYKVRDNIEVSSAVSFSNSKRPPLIYTNEAGAFYTMKNLYPTFRPIDLEGNPATGRGVNYGNPRYWIDKYVRKNNTRRTTLNVGLDWEILPNLILKAQANLYQIDNRAESFNKEFKIQTSALPDRNRNASVSTANDVQQQHNVTLSYGKNHGLHNFSVLGGGEMFSYSNFNFSAAGSQAATDDIYTLNAATVPTSVSSSISEYRMMSVFGRLNYDYDGKYLLTGVMRSDGTSRLSKDNRWGVFPGVSVGWNVHRESFFENSAIDKYLSKLKARVSYGVNGNIAGISDYEVQGVYGLITPYDQQSAFLNTGIVNEALRWEKSKSLDVGLDLGLFGNKVTVMFDYFNRQTADLLTNLSLPDYTGFSEFRTNLGSLLNSGIESQVNISVLEGPRGITWDVGFNASFVKNRILKLPYNGNENNRQGGHEVFDPASGEVVWVGGYQEGGSIGDVFGFVQQRILKDWEDVNATVPNRYDAIAQIYGPTAYANLQDKTGKYPIEPGDVLWADLDGNDIINSLDRVKMGNIFPKWTGGMSSSLSYKNFSLYTRLDFAAGHIIYNHLVAETIGQYSGTLNSIDWVKDMWREDNRDTDLPKFYYADLPKLNIKRSALHTPILDNHSSRFYEKGDYISLREVTLGYNISTALLEKLKLSSAKLSVTAQNLHYFTGYSGSNPELGGLDDGRYPMPKVLIVGLSIKY